MDIKNFPIVEVATGLSMIYEIMTDVKNRTGVELTPETIGEYAARRTQERHRLNAEQGIQE